MLLLCNVRSFIRITGYMQPCFAHCHIPPPGTVCYRNLILYLRASHENTCNKPVQPVKEEEQSEQQSNQVSFAGIKSAGRHWEELNSELDLHGRAEL